MSEAQMDGERFREQLMCLRFPSAETTIKAPRKRAIRTVYLEWFAWAVAPAIAAWFFRRLEQVARKDESALRWREELWIRRLPDDLRLLYEAARRGCQVYRAEQVGYGRARRGK